MFAEAISAATGGVQWGENTFLQTAMQKSEQGLPFMMDRERGHVPVVRQHTGRGITC